ncbi:MAG: xanthine dehydrogenase small subunit [Bacteroidota bacterium]
MQDKISFILDDKIETIEFGKEHKPTDTVLNYLRKNPCHKGVKEGCAEGDCGACTVVLAELNSENKLHYKAIDSCLVFLPMLQGKQLITVENLSTKENQEEILHPVQDALVKVNGSQCGFCTPGIVMSMFSLYKNKNNPSKEVVEDALTGNLCRCTGYKPIIEATIQSCVNDGRDHFSTDEKAVTDLLNEIKNSSQSIDIKTEKQEYFQPLTKKEALDYKEKFPDAIVTNGATDVALRVTKRHELLTQIIDLSHVDELKKCVVSEYVIKFGSGMSLEDVKRVSEKELPSLHDNLAVFGSKQIREIGTIGGNVGSSSPISDTLPLLMVYNADIKLQDSKSDRLVNMNDYILGYRQTAKKANELITKIIIPRPNPKTQIKFYKISKRKDLDISTVSAAFSLLLNGNLVEEIKIAYGGMAAVTKRVIKAENYLIGKPWDREFVEKAMEIIGDEFTPLSDARSGAEFRTSVSKNLILKFWDETKLD